jgi:hypothetical protein
VLAAELRLGAQQIIEEELESGRSLEYVLAMAMAVAAEARQRLGIDTPERRNPVIEAGLAERKSLREIAKEAGCSPETVRRYAIEQGVPPVSRAERARERFGATAERDQIIERGLRLRQTLRVIADDAHCSVQTVRRYAVKHNIPLVPLTERKSSPEHRAAASHSIREAWLKKRRKHAGLELFKSGGGPASLPLTYDEDGQAHLDRREAAKLFARKERKTADDERSLAHIGAGDE